MTLARTLSNCTLATRSLRRASAAMALSLAALPGASQNQLWVRQFGTISFESAYAAAPDGAGGVYVGGETTGSLGGPSAGGSDAWVARYDGAGNQVWIRQLGTNADEWTNATAPDASGGVYMSGWTGGSLGGPHAGGRDAWLARYDSAGNQLWIRQLGTISFESAYAAAPDGSGGVYVSGDTYGSLGGPNAGNYDAWLARYDSAGNQTWIRQLGTSYPDHAYAAAPDGSGGVYVSGETDGSLGGPNSNPNYQDGWLAHYDSAGNQTWIRQLGTSNNEYLRAAALDGSGGLYVSGSTFGGLGGPSAGSYDAWLARYDSSGNQLWIRQLGTSDIDYASAAALDGSGGVYVSGDTWGSLGGPNAGANDAWLAHYDGTGNQLWVRQFGTISFESASAAAPDASGGVYLGGGTAGSLGGPSAGGNDAWLARYDLCGLAVNYCTPATTTHGCLPSITGTGSASASAGSGFTITVSSVEGQKSGLIFYGMSNAGWSPTPWASGSTSFLCVKAPTQRTPTQNSGGTFNSCNGVLAIDWNAFIATTPGALGTPFAGGETVYAQGWFRDPAAPKTTNLSNGLVFAVCP